MSRRAIQSEPAPASAGELEEAHREFATVGEVADYLRLSRATVYKLMGSGELEYVKLVGSRRIPWTAVTRLIDRNTCP
jgi:excisionase family DNA binding protein